MEAMPWAIGCVTVPLAAALVAFGAGERGSAVVGGLTAPIVAVLSGCLVAKTLRVGAHWHRIGGWGAPLGIDLHVDGLAVILVALTSTVGLFVSTYALWYFAAPHRDETVEEADEDGEERDDDPVGLRQYFWPIWLLLWGGMHGLFLSSDIFNLYVTLELVGLSAVALVALAGDEAVGAAMRYLLVTLVGSMFFLLGVGLLYAAFGTLDLTLLAERVEPGPAVWAAVGLMSTGLMLKTAIFPVHFWLPPAHAAAPTPVSAVLSGLVVKTSFYLLARLWLEVFNGVVDLQVAQLLAAVGVVAIVWGSIQAILRTKLKLLVAYSTVAQLGYLFVVFPLAYVGATDAWRGGFYYVVSHGCAKAAMFLAAGNFMRATGAGTITALRGTGSTLFFNFAAFTLAGVTLMGLPPSGGFIGKWLIARAAIEAGQWSIVVVVFLGGLLAAAYVFKVVQMAFIPTKKGEPIQRRAIPGPMQWTALGLAVVPIVLGLVAYEPLAVLEIGDPFHSVFKPGGAP